mgnify:CR=1 FL=1
MKTVFVSYSHEDSDFVERLIIDLRASQISATYDKWLLNVGDSIIDKIAQAVTNADGVIAILSPNSVQSNWVKKELALAMTGEIERQGVTLFPAMIGDCTVPAVLSDKLYADFRKNYYDGLRSLVKALCPGFYASHQFIQREKIGRELDQLRDLLAGKDLAAIRAWCFSHRHVLSNVVMSEVIPIVAVGDETVDCVGIASNSAGHHLSLIVLGSPTWNRQNPDELVRESERLEGLLRWCREHEQDVRRTLARRINNNDEAVEIAPIEPLFPSWVDKFKLPLKFRAKLLYGRRAEYGPTENDLRQAIHEKANQVIEIMSYDRVLDLAGLWTTHSARRK